MAAPADSPSGARLALVVATGTYTDPGLRRLRAPARDAADLAEVLADPGIGGFAVSTVIDQSAQQIRLAVEDFLDGRGTGDLLLVYLSCHGLLDARRRLYFAASDTLMDRLGSTGVEAAWVLDQLEHCRARRQVLILDSCFSGAFAHGTKGEPDLRLRDRLTGQGRGRVVLTASTATEYSFEGDPTDAAVSAAGSVFTAAMVKGLRTGDADTDHDGHVSVDDAYAYVFDQVQAAGAAQTPQRWLYGAEGTILLARVPSRPASTRQEREFSERSVYASAESACREAVRLDPDSASAHYNLGTVLLNLDRYPEAEAVWREAIRLDPGNASAHRNLGGVLLNLERYPEAETAYREAIRLDPDNASAHRNLGGVLSALKRYREAETAWREAIRLDPGNAATHGNLGWVLCELKRYREAESACREAIQLDPDDTEARYNLGTVLLNLKRYPEAETAYREAVRLDPGSASAYYKLGVVLSELKRYGEAETAYREAIRLDPAHTPAYIGLAAVLNSTKQYREARAAAKEAARLDPTFLNRAFAAILQWTENKK